eukprot:9473451-Pyramimonas_sp.AAC.1
MVILSEMALHRAAAFFLGERAALCKSSVVKFGRRRAPPPLLPFVIPPFPFPHGVCPLPLLRFRPSPPLLRRQ